MRISLVVTVVTLWLASAAQSQEIVEVPASKADVALPEDIFILPPGQWYVARQVSQGNEPCTPDACEAGFNSGNLVISVEHAKEFVRVIAGFRGCQAVAFNEVETGNRPGKYGRGKVSDLIKKAVKAAGKTCKVTAPSVPDLDVASLFPRQAK